MTNNEIVEYVYHHYKILDLIKKLIPKSIFDRSCDDLEQYIYLKLLETNNEVLNELFESGVGYAIRSPKNKLGIYISKIILNQRNLQKYSEYGKYKISDDKLIEENEIEGHDFRIDFIFDELSKYEFCSTGLTPEELKISMCYELYKFKIQRNYTIPQLAKHFKCSVSSINLILRYAKKSIRDSYENNFDYDPLFDVEYYINK